MGDEFQECSGCKFVKQVDNFGWLKTDKNKDEINRKKRERKQRRKVLLIAAKVVI